MTSGYDFDAARFRLGKLCPRGHEHGGTGKSLRRNNSSAACLSCEQERGKSEAAKVRLKVWHEANKKTQQEKARERMAALRQNDEYRDTCRIRVRLSNAKAKAKRLGNAAERVTFESLRDRFEVFGNCCAYCGQAGLMEIEHVVCINKGGPHKIENIVPACTACNSSKRGHDMETWYRSQPFFSALRLRRIQSAAGDAAAD